MDLHKTFSVDEKLEEEGVWITLDPHSAIKVARINNKAFQAAIVKKGSHSKVAAKFINDLEKDVLIEIIAKTVLVDWEGITVKGEPIEYSVENAIKMMTEYKDFFDLVVELSTSGATFKAKASEEDKEELKKR